MNLLLARIVVQRHIFIHRPRFQNRLRVLSKIRFAKLILIYINDPTSYIHLLRIVLQRHFDVFIHFFVPCFSHFVVRWFLKLLLALVSKRNV